jgi:hypothetical protein
VELGAHATLVRELSGTVEDANEHEERTPAYRRRAGERAYRSSWMPISIT